MSTKFPELERMRLRVAAEVRERHLAAIETAIASARAPRLRRFRLLAAAAALILALPVIALASDDAVPGDILYPIKLWLEPVVSVIDPDVEVDHRVREAEVLLDREAEPDLVRDRVDRARSVVTDEHPDHVARLEVIVDRLEGLPDSGSDQPVTPDEPSEGSQEPEPREGSREDGRPKTESDSQIGPVDEADNTTTTTVSRATTQPADGRRDG